MYVQYMDPLNLFTGDGHKTNKKIGSVMAVFLVMKEGKHQPAFQDKACLYSGT